MWFSLFQMVWNVTGSPGESFNHGIGQIGQIGGICQTQKKFDLCWFLGFLDHGIGSQNDDHGIGSQNDDLHIFVMLRRKSTSGKKVTLITLKENNQKSKNLKIPLHKWWPMV